MDNLTKGLLDKYLPLKERYLELKDYLESPEIIADNKLYLRYAEEKNSLEQIYTLGEALKLAIELNDKEETDALYTLLTEAMLPHGDRDERSAILELKAENPQNVPLLKELFSIYEAYAKKQGYKLNICEQEEKFTSFSVDGKGAYFKLKGETGIHKSSGGKIGNSQVWVSVMPAFDDVTVNINPQELRTDIFHSSGAGGQNINKVATAVRLTHLPTNIVVVSRSERSQLQNRNRALAVLRTRLYEHYLALTEKDKEKVRSRAYNRSRTERVRLLDFDLEKVTDLRLNISTTLKALYAGDLNLLLDPLLIKEAKK